MRRYLLGVVLWSFGNSVLAADIVANVDWLTPTTVGTTVSGMIDSVAVHKGGRVNRGDLMVRLDQREFKAAVIGAEAAVALATAVFAEAVREETRALELYDQTLMSDHDLQIARIGRAEAEASLRHADTRKIRAEIELERCVVKAPFDGVVSGVHVAAEQMVLNHSEMLPMITLVPLHRMRALGSLKDDQSGTVNVGMVVLVAVGESWAEGRVTELRVQEKQGSTLVEVEFPVSAEILNPGQSTLIRVAE